MLLLAFNNLPILQVRLTYNPCDEEHCSFLKISNLFEINVDCLRDSLWADADNQKSEVFFCMYKVSPTRLLISLGDLFELVNGFS